MHNILLEIIEKKKLDLSEQKKDISIEVLRQKAITTNYASKFKKNMVTMNKENIAIIAEVKLASPADPSFAPQVDIVNQAVIYEKAQADAISFITEKSYFKGDISFIPRIKEKVNIPILQKDFVIDAFQIYQARALGSDAILLIACLIDKQTLITFVRIAQEIGIEPVVEVNSDEDLEKAVETETEIIAANARDLKTLHVDVIGACNVMKKISDEYITLGFSGINSSQQVLEYKKAGADGVLIGTSLMRAENIHDFISSLRAIERRAVI